MEGNEFYFGYKEMVMVMMIMVLCRMYDIRKEGGGWGSGEWRLTCDGVWRVGEEVNENKSKGMYKHLLGSDGDTIYFNHSSNGKWGF